MMFFHILMIHLQNAIHKYLNKLSGPLMDRIDMHIEVDNVNFDDITNKIKANINDIA